VIELRLLRHAVTLGRLRNFSRAAEALHLAQPSLSRSIASLEEALGVQLFDRGTKGVEPTAYGRLLLERGAALLAGEAELRRELELLAGLESGTLVVGAGPYAMEVSVGTALTRLLRAHPRLRVRAITASPEDVARKVLAGEVDVGVASATALGEAPQLQLEALPSHDVFFAVRPGHPLAGKSRLTLEDVLRFPLVSTLLAGESATAAAAYDGAGSIDPDSGNFTPALHVDSLSLARRIARETDALFPGTRSMLAPDVEAKSLVTLDFHHPGMRTDYSLISLRDRSPSPAARVLIEAVREVEAEVASADARPARLRAARPQ
jgi:DNA-binding transcriptional LysR family regulator